MSDSAKCPRCGNELPTNFSPGVCPACLMQQGMSPSSLQSAAGNGNRDVGRRRSWTPPTPAELAPRFPQLEIVELLGQGGMGAVYKVRQRDLDRWAALKVLPDEVAHDPTFSERFQREARALALLGHQHIVIVYEFGQREGVYFLLMEYIDGVTLRQAMRAGQVTDKDALAIVSQICEALQFAHEEGVVHRDIKPENILIDKRGRVKIADFGLAKLLGRSFEVPTLTGTHQVMGTPVYMAPEQMEGKRGIDHRADIFSLGVVFYELLTGELPLGRFAPPSQKYQLDVRLDDVVFRTLEKEPDRRYQHASDVKCDIESIRSQPQATSQAPPVVPLVKPEKRRTRWSWKKRITVLLFSCIGILFVGIVAGISANNWRFQQEIIARKDRRSLKMANEIQRLKEEVIEAKNQTNNPIAQTPGEHRTEPIPIANVSKPEDANNWIQFTDEGPKLYAKLGHPLLTNEYRTMVNQILANVHAEYLQLEAGHCGKETLDDGTQISTINAFKDEVAMLHRDLWTRIDSQIPIELQSFLRLKLILFADRLEGPHIVGMPFAGGVSRGPEKPQNMRRLQLLGWRQGREFPLRILIRREGNGYRWLFSSPDLGMIDTGESLQLPSGLRRFWNDEASEKQKPVTSLNESMPDPASENSVPTATEFESSIVHNPASTVFDPNTQEPRDEVVATTENPAPTPVEAKGNASYEAAMIVLFSPDGPMLNPEFGKTELNAASRKDGNEHSASHRRIVNRILQEMHREFLEVERRHTKWDKQADGTQIAVVEGFADEIRTLENKLWTEIDLQLGVDEQRFLRENLPLSSCAYGPHPLITQFQQQYSGFPDVTDAHRTSLRHIQLFGWKQEGLQGDDGFSVEFPLRLSIGRVGKWYRWSIDGSREKYEIDKAKTMIHVPIVNGYDPELPSALRRFWREDPTVDPVTSTRVTETNHAIEDDTAPVPIENSANKPNKGTDE